MSLMNYRDLVFKRMIQILSVVLILGGCASQPKRVTQQPEGVQGPGKTHQQLALISNIAVEEKEDAVRVVIKGSAPLTYEVTQAESPLRLIIEVADARLAISGAPIPVRKGVISEIVPSAFEKEGKNCVRVEIAMNNTAHYEVLPAENDLWIDFPKPLPAVKKAEKVFDVIIDDSNKDYAQVYIIADGTIENFNSFNLQKPTRLVIDFPKLNLLTSVKEKVSTCPLIKKVRWGKHVDYLRMVFESPLNELPTFEVVPTSQGATIFFGRGFEGRKSQLISMTPSGAQRSGFLASSPGTPAPEAKVEAQPTTLTPPATPAMEKETQEKATIPAGEKPFEASTEKSKQAPAKEQEVPAKVVQKEKKGKYTGSRISLDFKDADINNILRLIAEVSNLNIVAGEDVRGTVTIRLQDVPWDQALDTILLSNNLGKTLDGNILRIAPIDKLEKQRREVLSAEESQAKLEPLKKALIPISYAQASQLKPVIQNSKVLSPRGSIEVDQRTNTLIVIDIERNIGEVSAIVNNLDTPIPQVLIEAKIIQINPTYTNELGVSWGGDINTTTGKAGTVGVGGDVSGSGKTGVTTSQSILDLLPAGIGPGVGASLAWGFFNKNFDIFNKIAAMEKDEKLEVISSPRVMTLDNQEALVEQGAEIPYLQIDTQAPTASTTSNLATTQFKKVTLSLKVVPHVTPDGSVMMDIEAKKDQISALTGAGGQPGIDTRKAITKVLVRSGDTVVIGGIYEDTNQDIRSSVPFFGRIPVLNFIFKGTSKSRQKTEMIIFITPTIITIPKKLPHLVIAPIS